ncbi:MAG: imelysin family protein [Reyranellaceae bacterium]
MKHKAKIWVGVGAYLLTSAAGGQLADHDFKPAKLLFSPAFAAGGEGGEQGEGGEGGEGGGVPETYKLNSTDPNAFNFDAKPQIAAYATLVHESYKASHAAAVAMQKSIDAFLANPTAANLARARFAWINARIPYLQTETFRFYDGPIDFADAEKKEEGPEGHINAWPLNEAFIDYVKGKPNSGLINDPKVKLTAAAILEKDQVSDEADVTTGWHAIEFLLWGQDLSATGPGDRKADDYLPGKVTNDRRRLYLRTVTQMLVGDLAGLVQAWEPGKPDNYAAKFAALDPREALGRIITGMAMLAGHELMSERLAVALDSGDQEDEHSCFSDTTRNDFIYNTRGIRNVWFGDVGSYDGAGLDELLGKVDPALNARIIGLLNRAEAAVAALPQPFDQVLASSKGSPERKVAEAAVVAFKELASGLKEAGAKLGVLISVSDK